MIWRQHWTDVLFLHFPVRRDDIQPLLPPPLVLDTWEGSAWLSYVFFRLNVRLAGLPAIPGLSSLLELNVRTYVRHRDHSGIWFLRMYADNCLAIRTARLLTPLCYERAAMIDRSPHSGRRHIECQPARSGAGLLAGDCAACGQEGEALPGSLDFWLLERYRLFVAHRDGRLLAADVEHPPWQSARAEFTELENDLVCDLGLSLAGPAAAHWSPGAAARFNAFHVVAEAGRRKPPSGWSRDPLNVRPQPARAGGRCAGR